MQNRRSFIQKTGLASTLLLIGAFPFKALAVSKTHKISILFTNGFRVLEPQATKNQGLEYLQLRADIIHQIRQEDRKVLLFDIGALFANTVYHDAFKGSLEIDALNMMKYDVVCIGEEELKSGTEHLSELLSKAKFTAVCSNYTVDKANLKDYVKAYCILEVEGVKIGVLGIGKPLESSAQGINISTENPLIKANEVAQYLKKKKHCDLVVCLSSFNAKPGVTNTFTNKMLACESEHIDLIISGHAPQSLSNKPMKYYNLKKQEVLVVSLGIGMDFLGRIDYIFSTEKNILSSNAQTVEIGK